MIRFLTHCVLCLLLGSALHAQNNTQRLLQQGMQLETEDRVAEAITIYERLLSERTNTGVLYRLASAYQKVGRYDDAIRLLEQRLKRAPGDITALNRLSDVYFSAGNVAQADRAMDRLLALSPNESAYAAAGQRYERMNLDAKAADIYRRGREILRKPGAFARELAQIHERAENYPASVREYATLSGERPQFAALVESKVARIASLAKDVDPLFDLLLGDVKAAHRDSRRTRLFVTFALAADLGDRALDELLLLPPDARIEGSLLRIGRELLEGGTAADAVRAFEALSLRTRNRSLQAQAAAGVARGLDLLGRSKYALDAYADVLAAPGSDPVRDEAAYRRGDLLLRMGMADSAASHLSAWTETAGRSAWRVRTIDLLGDIHLAAGRLDVSAGWYGRNITENRGKEAGIAATFKLARLYTIEKAYGRAQKALSSVLNGGLATMVYNDALEMSDILETGLADDPTGLDAFAEGLRIEGRGQRRAAAEAYVSAGRTHTGALRDVISRRGIDLLVDDGAWAVAERSLGEMIDRNTTLASWATYTLGLCVERQGRTQEAIVIYETVLTDFPLTLEADRSRERLTDLRTGHSTRPEAG